VGAARLDLHEGQDVSLERDQVDLAGELRSAHTGVALQDPKPLRGEPRGGELLGGAAEALTG
jgi:hypothetical protein